MHSKERKSKTEAEEAMEKLNREGLFHPMLFCEQEKREARFLQHVWTIRQRAVKALQTQNLVLLVPWSKAPTRGPRGPYTII